MKAAALSKGRRRPISSFEEHRLLTGGALLGGVAVLIPLLALIALSLSGSGADWAHLARNVLPVALKTTAWVMAGKPPMPEAMIVAVRRRSVSEPGFQFACASASSAAAKAKIMNRSTLR